LAFVNGWLYGIDRQDAGIVWRRGLNSEPLPMAASHVAPVLVQMWRQSIAEGMPGLPDAPRSDAPRSNAFGTLRLIDKRTGLEILTHRDPNMQCYSALIPDENFETLDVYTEQKTFRLTYKSESEESQQERASEKN
jgi:hypothetical protein